MRKLHVVAVTLVVVLCSLGGAEAADSLWQRMAGGYPNHAVVYQYTYEYRSPELELTARVPQLVGLSDTQWQAEFNWRMIQKVMELEAALQEAALEAQELDQEFRWYPYQGIVDFEVKLNQGGLLSIAIVTYTFTGGAHGMTYYDYVNVDLTTGAELTFYDFFNTEAEIQRAAQAIDEKIAQEPDWYFIDQFTPGLFTADQGFYMTDSHVVVCFGLYELAPYASGIQEFAASAP